VSHLCFLGNAFQISFALFRGSHLELGIWRLFGTWKLELGAFILGFAFMRKLRTYFLLSLGICAFLLLIYGLIRALPEPVPVTCFKIEPGDHQVIFIIKNASARDVTWQPVVEVGGRKKWHAANKQRKLPGTARALSHGAEYWLPVSIPEERGTWRVRCLLVRQPTRFEQKLRPIYNALHWAPWNWIAISPTVSGEEP